MGQYNADQATNTYGSSSTNPTKAGIAALFEGVRGTFASRADFVTAVGAGDLTSTPDGQVYSAGGLEYRKLAASTAIADLAGFVPDGAVNVRHFGTVGDGVADDTAAIHAARDYMVSIGGGVLHFEAETYGVSGTEAGAALNFNSLGVPLTLLGKGRNLTSIILIGENGFAQVRNVRLFGLTDFKMIGVTVDGNTPTLPQNLTNTEQRNCVIARDMKRCIFQDCGFYRADGDGVNVGGSTGQAAYTADGMKFIHCDFDHNFRNGATIGAESPWRDLSFISCTFGAGNDTQQIDYEPIAVYTEKSRGLYVTDCIFAQQPDQSDRFAMGLTGGTIGLDGVFVSGCYLGSGLVMRYVDNVTFANNHEITSLNSSAPLITVDRDCENVKFINTKISSAASVVAGQGMISIREIGSDIPVDISFVGCDISYTGTAAFPAIYVQDANGLSIKDCRVSSAGTTEVILVHAQTFNVDDLTIDGNEITSASGQGVELRRTAAFVFNRTRLTGNTFKGAGVVTMFYFNAGGANYMVDCFASGNIHAEATADVFRSGHQTNVITSGSVGCSANWSTFGTPEAAVMGSIGDTAMDRSTGTAYRKTSGTRTNTGWVTP